MTLLLVVILVVAVCFYLRPNRHSVDAPLAVFKGVARKAQPAASAPVASHEAKTPSAVTGIDICGYGKVAIDASDPFAAGRYLSRLTHKVRGRWISALLDSDDVRARAAGLFVESKLVGNGQAEPIAEQSRDALVQLAVGADDPAVYALAVYACDTYANAVAGEACQRITLTHWAKLDSDNAVPWLLLAGEAHTRHDLAAENAAFAGATKAHKVDAYNYLLYNYTEADLPTDATALERWYLALELVGIESATGQLQYSSASKHCSADAMRDSEVPQQCGAMAELLVSHGTTLLDLGFGTAIGRRVGWDKTRIDRLAEERDALMQSSIEATSIDDEDPWSCDAARRGNAQMEHWAHLGEIEAARDLLQKSGETAAELAARRRDFRDEIRREAQQPEETFAPEAND